jgi:hypothetical protein
MEKCQDPTSFKNGQFLIWSKKLQLCMNEVSMAANIHASKD